MVGQIIIDVTVLLAQVSSLFVVIFEVMRVRVVKGPYYRKLKSRLIPRKAIVGKLTTSRFASCCQNSVSS